MNDLYLNNKTSFAHQDLIMGFQQIIHKKSNSTGYQQATRALRPQLRQTPCYYGLSLLWTYIFTPKITVLFS